MAPEPPQQDPVSADRAAAAATIARVLEQIGVIRPVSIAYEADGDGGLAARVILEPEVCELLCSLSPAGDLISARLIEL